ncbi:aspartate aminotransferase family protein [Bradyrhizobium sp. CSS354]|uniref:aminotransferase family protein n=1 Tax=Bradyrhizobium sp. CSS354 TaxID=2699172 RepID=UPI0023B1531A|nr:aspartate aminotransferase family protein [Bradyrhizobium sp. CSS354]MDE5466255.1 aminotransferase class III-fold pyridoxal phosphate-dependent enzyme [Bradyrhizobium sp. CSS354]
MADETMRVREFAPIERQALNHVWIHSARWLDLAEGDGLHVIVRGEGSTLYDAHGRTFIDGLAGLFLVNVGHGRKEIGEAMAKQAAEIAYVSAASYTSLPAVQLAEVLAQLTPGDLNRFFFCSGGSEAVESAIKIVKQVQVMRGFPKRYKIIARRGGYHGATMGAMSITSSREEKFFGPFMYGVSFVSSPNSYRNDFGLEGEAGDLACANAIEQEILAQGPETVAAFIGEPVSTANNAHVPSKKYWQRVREICDRYGVLFVLDEVINGFGRTGTMFATEQFGVVPDLMTMAKGLSSGYAPIGAVAVSSRIYDEFKKQDAALGHLLTFGGQAVSCAAALKNIEILQREDLPQRSASNGVYMLDKMQSLRSHPTVGDVRGLGLMCVAELVSNKTTKEPFPLAWKHPFIRRVSQLMAQKGLLSRVITSVHLCPPLVATREEIDRMVTIVDESLTIAEKEHGFN